jgi:diaminohydroxyphosphoribosylaminopyrimidine deaminase/5-amino-6-(5-phosphoribosylamino)uracil reductase
LNLEELLKHLGAMEYTNVLVEGGGEVLGSFFEADLVDEAHVFIAPMIIGGRSAPHAVGGADIIRLADASRMQIAGMDRSGPDVHLRLRRP